MNSRSFLHTSRRFTPCQAVDQDCQSTMGRDMHLLAVRAFLRSDTSFGGLASSLREVVQ